MVAVPHQSTLQHKLRAPKSEATNAHKCNTAEQVTGAVLLLQTNMHTQISPLTSCWEAAPSASKPARRRFAALIAPLLEAPGNAKSMREIRQLGSAPKRSMTKCCTMYLDVSSFPHSTWIRWHTGHQATCAPLERNCSSTFKHVVTVVCTGAEHGSDRNYTRRITLCMHVY